MFNDKFDLNTAVLEGRKTQTRRMITIPKTWKGKEVFGFQVCKNAVGDWYTELTDDEGFVIEGSYIKNQYEIGDIVAIAQSYKDIEDYLPQDPIALDTTQGYDNFVYHNWQSEAGWNNKMFTKSELMPHQIRITNVRIEHLKDISAEDCKSEGIWFDAEFKRWYFGKKGSNHYIISNNLYDWKYNVKVAYSALIDKISGKGTWESNPFVFVYDFELIK